MGRNIGSHTKIKPTQATADFHTYFLGPFLTRYIYAENEEERVAGYRAFFNTANRRLCFCHAKGNFKMPGAMWVTTSQPFKLINGTGRRDVRRGASFVVRVDRSRPDICEIEYDEQVFVLTAAQYDAISEYVNLEA